MLSKEEIEICASNFGHEYFFHYDIGDWKQIKDYGKDIPKIIRAVIIQVNGIKDYDLFRVIIEDINNI